MRQSDFLVIGSGIAGLIYALDVCKKGKVTVICKNDPFEGNTRYAQGGIASVMNDEEDSFESHIRDTLVAGAGLCKEEVVKLVISEGPQVVKRLREIGASFDMDSPDNFSLGKEGGHSYRRILHAGDTTGAEIQRALIERIKCEKNIEILSYHMALDFITTKDLGISEGKARVVGCYALNIKTNEVETIPCSTCLLASGGLGKVYLYTSNPDVATGDGVAMAYRAGAEIRNMEFIQFHPTCFHHPYAKNFLITEALRGEGGRLYRRDGVPFMEKYHPSKELAPRDIVARAIDNELKTSGDDHVLLDISHHTPEFIKKRFPSIYAHLRTFGIDITENPVPVVPAAHYSCGGVSADHFGRTSIEGLYAAGEVACSGLHGANRLASNSLLEAVVFGRRAALHSMDTFSKASDEYSIPPWDSLGTRNSDEQVLVSHLWDETRRTMWNLVGIVRSEARLQLAKKRIEISLEEINNYYWSYHITGDLIELRNITLVAKLIVESALKRKESRGLHFIQEYPDKDPLLEGVETILTLEDS